MDLLAPQVENAVHAVFLARLITIKFLSLARSKSGLVYAQLIVSTNTLTSMCTLT